MLAIEAWGGNESQGQIFINSSGWGLPLLLGGLQAGFLADYDTGYDYFIVVDHEGIISWRGSPQTPNHTNMANAVDNALAAISTSASPEAPQARHQLLAGYPNPFNPMTRIPYELADSQGGDVPVKLEILDLRGRVVKTLVNTRQVTGQRHEATWDGTSNAGRKLPSGSYISQLTVGGDAPQARILTLVK
jgi:hypothetical protein